jgi:hypothetical protein
MKKTVVRPSDMLRLLVGWGEGKADEPKRSATCKRANSLSPATTLSSPPETALSTRLLDGSIIIETGYIDTMHSDTTNCQQKQLSDFLESVQLSKFQKPKTALYCSPFEYPTANLDTHPLPNAKASEQRMMNTSTPSALVTNDHTHGASRFSAYIGFKEGFIEGHRFKHEFVCTFCRVGRHAECRANDPHARPSTRS